MGIRFARNEAKYNTFDQEQVIIDNASVFFSMPISRYIYVIISCDFRLRSGLLTKKDSTKTDGTNVST